MLHLESESDLHDLFSGVLHPVWVSGAQMQFSLLGVALMISENILGPLRLFAGCRILTPRTDRVPRNVLLHIAQTMHGLHKRTKMLNANCCICLFLFASEVEMHARFSLAHVKKQRESRRGEDRLFSTHWCFFCCNARLNDFHIF